MHIAIVAHILQPLRNKEDEVVSWKYERYSSIEVMGLFLLHYWKNILF